MANRRVLYSDIIDCGYTAVDMGTNDGVLWCTRNVGIPLEDNINTDIGLYFAGGDIRGYTYDECKNGIFSDDNHNVTIDSSTTLPYSNDAASVLMGKNWRIPTKTEWENLLSVCSIDLPDYTIDFISLVSQITGNRLVFSYVPGYNNLRFLPVHTVIWTSTIDSEKENSIYAIEMYGEEIETIAMNTGLRYDPKNFRIYALPLETSYILNIRPVLDYTI